MAKSNKTKNRREDRHSIIRVPARPFQNLAPQSLDADVIRAGPSEDRSRLLDLLCQLRY